MIVPRLLLSSTAGPPDDPRTWSGTPARLLTALRESAGMDVVPWNSGLAGRSRQLARHTDRLLGLGHPFVPGPARRWLAARGVHAAARGEHCRAVLHLGTYDVPLHTPALPSFLYVDNSYDIWERHASAARQLPAHQRRWFRRLEHLALSRMHHVFTIGRHVAENFIETYGVPRERVTAVGSGLGSIQPYFGAKDYSRGRLLIVAKVRPHEKGLPLLLEAFRLARAQRGDLQLTVVGGAKIPELQGVEGVHGTGWISAEELQDLFNQSCLFVMPATYEPWGLSYLEALACRTPIVGLERNAVPEISDDGRYGFLLQEAAPGKLAQLILQALADPARLEQMGRAGQEHCLSTYKWSRVAQAMSAVMNAAQSAGLP